MDLNQKALLDRLVENKDISKTGADQIEVESLKKNLTIKDYLFKYGQIPRQHIIKAQSEMMGVPYVDLENSPIDSQAVGLISESVARSYGVVPYKFDAKLNSIYLGTADPF